MGFRVRARCAGIGPAGGPGQRDDRPEPEQAQGKQVTKPQNVLL
jgi:hypothetical protein